ncbi:MAG TPA: alpha/beta fold hydrolase [Streptosporangiaceae bacterium]
MPWHPEPDRCPVLLCLPPAGAGCAQFRPWQTWLGDDVSVVGVQLPGRENRWAEPMVSSMSGAVDAVLAELARLIPADHPIVVFGHSFGALLGYEIARALRTERDQRLHGLVVAACRPPACWVGAGRGLVDDDGELTRLLEARGLDAEDLDEETRELMLEILRQDARLSLSYTGEGLGPVDCALEAWGGAADMTVSADQVSGWRDYAIQTFRARLFAGGHYFCLDDPEPALALLANMAAKLDMARSRPRQIFRAIVKYVFDWRSLSTPLFVMCPYLPWEYWCFPEKDFFTSFPGAASSVQNGDKPANPAGQRISPDAPADIDPPALLTQAERQQWEQLIRQLR